MTGAGDLILCDGSLGGLLALGVAAERASSASGREGVPPPLALVSDDDRGDAGRRVARALGVDTFTQPGLRFGWEDAPRKISETLLASCSAAEAVGARTVIWPLLAVAERVRGEVSNAGDPVEALGEVLNRSLLVSRLAGLDTPDAARIDAPYADLEAEQVAELVAEMQLPAETCWWWGGQDGAAAELMRLWWSALERAGWAPPAESGAAAGDVPF